MSCSGTFQKENKYPNELQGPGGISQPASSALFVTVLANLIDPLLNYFFLHPFIWTGHTDKLFDHKPPLSAKSHFASLWLMIQPFVLEKVSGVSTSLRPLFFFFFLKPGRQGHKKGKRRKKHALNAAASDQERGGEVID